METRGWKPRSLARRDACLYVEARVSRASDGGILPPVVTNLEQSYEPPIVESQDQKR